MSKEEKKKDQSSAPPVSVADALMGKKTVVKWDYKLIKDKPNCFPPPELWFTASGSSDIWDWARYTWTDSTKTVSSITANDTHRSCLSVPAVSDAV
jgi:hypothetical protein